MYICIYVIVRVYVYISVDIYICIVVQMYMCMHGVYVIPHSLWYICCRQNGRGDQTSLCSKTGFNGHIQMVQSQGGLSTIRCDRYIYIHVQVHVHINVHVLVHSCIHVYNVWCMYVHVYMYI